MPEKLHGLFKIVRYLSCFKQQNIHSIFHAMSGHWGGGIAGVMFLGVFLVYQQQIFNLIYFKGEQKSQHGYFGWPLNNN